MANMQPELQDLIGFRFNPTVEELLSYYLMPKITRENPLPPGMTVPHIPFIKDLYSMSPTDIVNQVTIRVDMDFIYAYTSVKKIVEGGKRVARATTKAEQDGGSGIGKGWKIQNGKKVILGNGEVGLHRTFNYSGKGSNGCVGSMGWVLHEYSLPDRGSDLVICRMHFNGKKGSSPGSDGSTSRSSVEQQSSVEQHSQRLPLPPPQPPPMKRSDEDRTGATSSLVGQRKKTRMCQARLVSSHDQPQQFALVPYEQNIIQPQEIQSNNQETNLVDQVIQDQPQYEHQSTDHIQEISQHVANRTITLEEIYRANDDIGDPFSEMDFDVSGVLDEKEEIGWRSSGMSPLLPLDDGDDDIFKDLPVFFD